MNVANAAKESAVLKWAGPTLIGAWEKVRFQGSSRDGRSEGEVALSTVVLFNHPGEEHVAKAAGPYPWNVDKHRRKYLEVQAKLAQADGTAFRREADVKRVGLWAEFEPDTEGRPFSVPERGPGGRLPESCHRLAQVGSAPAGGQNTDPWIFGEVSRYGFCRQSAAQTSYLRNLAHGDLLLFGSFFMMDGTGNKTSHFNFFLDTVFVVDAGYPWSREDRIPVRLLDAAYERAAASRFDPKEKERCTLYEGMMLTGVRSSQPFCFSPCQPSESAGPVRMARPMISDLFDYKTKNPQVVHRFEDADARSAWRKVLERCVSTCWKLAVQIEDPGVREGAGEGGATGAC